MPRDRKHRLPFENRWTSGEEARHWFLLLERLGVERARVHLALEYLAPPNEITAMGVQRGFIEDWLSYRERRRQRSKLIWRVVTLIAALMTAAAAALLGVVAGVSTTFRP